jgi:hypothetical protein
LITFLLFVFLAGAGAGSTESTLCLKFMLRKKIRKNNNPATYGDGSQFIFPKKPKNGL